MNIKTLFLVVLAVLGFAHADAQKAVNLTVKNPANTQRHEVVEADAYALRNQLGIGANDPIRVRNAHGQLIPCQLTYDGKLLIEAAVRPNGEVAFRVEAGQAPATVSYASGAMFPLRKDDVAWENDRGAYRVYGPALRRTGERALGVDVWTKSTPLPVVARRYRQDYEGNVQEDSLRRKGDNDKAREVDMATSFHLDHGDGMDGYGVGASLGCGASALVESDRLSIPWCYEKYRILDNGPLRFTVELTFHPMAFRADSVVQHQLVSLDKGSHFNRCNVWYEGLTDNVSMAMGVVVHKEDVASVLTGEDRVLYADPTDNPQRHNSQIYVGCLFPEGVSQTRTLMLDRPDGSIAGHAIGIVPLRPGQTYTYFFGSAWSNYDVPSFDAWKLCANEELEAIRHPLTVTVVQL